MADVETGEPLGNFPQAFSYVELVNAAFISSGEQLPDTVAEPPRAG